MNWRTDEPTANVIVALVRYNDDIANGLQITNYDFRVLEKKADDFYIDFHSDREHIPTERITKWADLEEDETVTDIELIQKSWYRQGYIDGINKQEPQWILEGLKYKENPKYGQPLPSGIRSIEEESAEHGEIWKDIVGYEGYYKVSNKGRILSLSRTRINGVNTHYISKEHIKSLVSDRNGYKQVKLYKDTTSLTRKVHRLVAEAFIPNPTNLPEINHKDENKENNAAENLEWCDRDYNIHYGTWVSRSSNHRPVAQYSLDGTFIKQYESIREASRETGIRHENIRNCAASQITNKEKGYYTKSAGGYIWKFI